MIADLTPDVGQFSKEKAQNDQGFKDIIEQIIENDNTIADNVASENSLGHKKSPRRKKLSISNLDQRKRKTGITNFKQDNPSEHLKRFSSENAAKMMRKETSQAKDEDKNTEILNVGFELFSLNLSRVLLIAVFLLITIPLFSNETYFKFLTSYQSGLITLGSLANSEKKISSDFNDLFDFYVDEFDKSAGSNRKILSLEVRQVVSTINQVQDFTDSNTILVSSPIYGDKATVNKIRPYVVKSFSSLTDFSTVPKDTYYVVIFIDNSYDENIDAMLGIFRSLFVLCVFGFLTFFFRRDTVKLLVQPMSKMKRTIALIKNDPITASSINDYQFLIEYLEIQR